MSWQGHVERKGDVNVVMSCSKSVAKENVPAGRHVSIGGSLPGASETESHRAV